MSETILSIELLGDGESFSYRIDVGECNDGSPWIGKAWRDGEEVNWDFFIRELASLQERGISDATRWTYDLICERVGIEGNWTDCLICRDSMKVEAAKYCPYTERDLCEHCFQQISKASEFDAWISINDALELEAM